MGKSYILIILACLGISGAEKSDAKKFGRHDFPEFTPQGSSSANEFQFIGAEKIVDARVAKLRGATGSYSISSVSPLLIQNDDIVTVSFESSSPKSSDWIGAYSPANSDITKTSPVKYGYCDDSDTYISTGKGSLTFNLTNLRADVQFYYFSGGTSNPTLVATAADKVDFKNYNQPLRPRVVPTGDYNVYNLLWSSASSTQPTLRWGKSPGVYDYTVSATTTTLSADKFCGSTASGIGYRDYGLIHTAAISGVFKLANKKIYYSFGDLATNDFSPEYVFHVPPKAGQQPTGRATTLALYCDMGRGSLDQSFTWNEYGRPAIYTAQSVGALVAAGKIDAIYHGGDISYARGYAAVWDFYLDMLSPVAGSALYLTNIGNHEADYPDSASYYNGTDSGGECSVATTTLLPMPKPATTNQPWWSYNVGLVHMVAMSTEHDFTTYSPQWKWLQADLASVDRTKTPWVIFSGHRPMYINSGYDGPPDSDIQVMNLMIEHVEPLLYQYKVNLAFWGHNHAVQRHSAVLNSTVIQASQAVEQDGETIHLFDDPQATVHFVIGTAGAAFTKGVATVTPVWNENVFYEYGYTIATAVNATTLDWKWYKAETGEIFEHTILTQSDPAAPFKPVKKN